MTPERKVSPAPRRPHEVYGFTEQERLFWRISQERFDALLNDDLTAIHDIVETSNNYGEFVFVTTSRSAEQGRVAMSFYGLGYHEYRERWIHNEWFWYQANIRPNMMDQQLTKDEAAELLQKRLEDIQSYMDDDHQTERGRLFELLADLTDEDGALAELRDLGENWENLMGDSDE